MNKNTLLVYPRKYEHDKSPVKLMSTSLLYLSGALRDICDNIIIFDANSYEYGMEMKRLGEIFARFKPSIVGINCLVAGVFPEVMKIAQYIKNTDDSVRIVLGGLHPTMFSHEILANCSYIDAVVLGEGEYAMQKLLRFYYGEISIDELDSVHIRNDTKRIYKEKQVYIEDLDKIPFPGYEYFNFQKYQTNVSNWVNPKKNEINSVIVPIITSRSCPNLCNFCAMSLVMGQKYRERSAESVFFEIMYLHKTYGVNYFQIFDDNFSYNSTRAKLFCKMIIDSGINVYFEAPSGLMIRTLDRELINLMAKAGFLRVSLAIESGNDYIRNKIMHKNITRDKIIDTFVQCAENGILTRAMFLIGMPEETEETLRDTYELINDIDCIDIVLSNLIPISGTKVFSQCEKDGLFTQGIDKESMWTGDYFRQNLLTPEVSYSTNAITRKYNVKPYKMTLDELAKWDERIQELIIEKTRSWKEHMLNTM